MAAALLSRLVRRAPHPIFDAGQRETREQFGQNFFVNIGQPELGQDPMLRFYLGQLGRLHELTAARVDLYSISSSERLIFVHHHKSDIDSEERITQSNGQLEPEEERIREFLSLSI